MTGTTTGTAGTDRPYPRFTGGQVLTHQDLNELRDFLDEQDRIIGRAIGFGITAGLTGAVEPAAAGKGRLTVDPGLAIDQLGRMLWLDTAAEWKDLAAATDAAGAAPAAETSFDFIDPVPGGITPVLVLSDADKAAPPCGETDCAGHSALRLRSAQVILVPGRLKTSQADFATEPLLGEAPLTIDEDGKVQGDFDRLRGAISARLTEVGAMLSAKAAQCLNGLVLRGSALPAVLQYRAAFLNHVFFAALDVLRVQALFTPSPRATTRPGIALGWIVVEGGAPVWNPAYRYDFEPPVGLANALAGSGALDPVTQMRNRLESLLLSYNEPTVPGPQDPPPGKGDFHSCPKGKKALAEMKMRLGIINPCFDVFFPPPKIPDHWHDIYLQEAPVIKGPGHGLVDPVAIDVVYGTDPLDFAQAGVVSLGPALGGSAVATANALKAFIADQGLNPDVQVLTAAEARALKGFSVQGAISLGDKLVLVKDQHGNVVEFGRVPNQQALKSAGGVLVATAAQAAKAVAGAQKAEQEVAGVRTLVSGLETSLSRLKTGDMTEFQQLAALAARVENTVVRDDLDRLRLDLKGDIRLAQEQAATLQQTVIEGTSKVSGLLNQHTNLKQDVTLSLDLVKQSQGRIDDLFKYRSSGHVPRDRFMPGLVDFLDTLRTTVVSSAPADLRDDVRSELAVARQAFGVLIAEAGTEPPPTVSWGGELATVVEALVAAAEAAGWPREELTRVRASARILIDRLRGADS